MIIRVTPFRVLITLLITQLLSPLGLQAGRALGADGPLDDLHREHRLGCRGWVLGVLAYLGV